MNTLSILEPVPESKMDILRDPFSSKCITDVILRWTLINGNPWIYARVKFINGNTQGEQKIESSSMNELIIKTEAFLKGLPK